MRCDCYLRKSTADQGKSVSRQERGWLTDCAAQGWKPGRAFSDPDLSASRYARKPRPDYAELVMHVRSGACEMLAMWEVSRGSRQMAEWVALLDLCRQHGVLIRIFGGDSPVTYDPRVPRDREELLREGINAERESETVSSRSRDGARDLAFSGKPPGPMLFGYTREYDERGKLVAQVLHPERAALVRRLAEDTLNGASLNSQAQRLNTAGIASPKGGRWTGQGIRRLLLNPGLAGKRVHNGAIVADGEWPELLDAQTRRKLEKLLTAPGRRRNISGDSALRWMLSGAARCGVCNKVLRGFKKDRYVCDGRGCTSAAIDVMDTTISDMIKERLRQEDAADIFAPRVDDAALQTAQAELDALVDQLEGFRDEAAKPNGLSPAGLVGMERRLQPLIDAAAAKVKRLATPPILGEYKAADVADRWESLPVTVRREFILAMASVVLSPCGKGGRWSIWRLAESRWTGDRRTWGDNWKAAGLTPLF